MVSYTGKEFLTIERLDDIVVYTCIESLHKILLLGEGGDENHRNVRVGVVMLKL
jgi:hypothetical protein